MSDQWIRASEISNYVYCRRAWWLQRKHGRTSQNVRELNAGSHHHQQHGRSLVYATWGRRLAYGLLFVLVAYVTFQLLMSTQ
jgi:hypothetical protein